MEPEMTTRFLTIPIGRYHVEFPIRRAYVPSAYTRQMVFMVDRLCDSAKYTQRSVREWFQDFLDISLDTPTQKCLVEEWFDSEYPLFTTEEPFSWSRTPLRNLQLTDFADELLREGSVFQKSEWEEAILDYDFLCHRATFVRDARKSEEMEVPSEPLPNRGLVESIGELFPEIPLRSELLREKKNRRIGHLRPVKPVTLRGCRVPLQIYRFSNRFELRAPVTDVQNYFQNWSLQDIENLLSKEQSP